MSAYPKPAVSLALAWFADGRDPYGTTLSNEVRALREKLLEVERALEDDDMVYDDILALLRRGLT